MPITINTNMSSLIAQRSLNSATKAMNVSIERMSTGYKINHAGDNAAGHSIANSWQTKIGSLDVAADNAATGIDLLTTAEESYALLTSHLQRVRDLTEQAANGTYGSQSLRAIQAEISLRLAEISRISGNVEFNGIKLMAFDTVTDANNKDIGMTSDGISLQVGLYAEANSRIELSVDLFANASTSGLFFQYLTGGDKASETCGGAKTLSAMLTAASKDAITNLKLNSTNGFEIFAAACTNLVYDAPATDDDLGTYTLQTTAGCAAKEMLGFIDAAINEISRRVTRIGAAQNRVQSAVTAIDVQSQNLTSSLSTLRDTDVAEESSEYIKQQILQQSSATLLSTANQLPSIALNLI